MSSFWLSLVRYANKRTTNIRGLRRVGVYVYGSIVRLNVFLPPPRVLLIGPAKSGTHLLSDCLSLMPKMMFSGRHFALSEFFLRREEVWEDGSSDSKEQAALDEPRLERLLKRCPGGMFVTAHANFHPVLRDLSIKLGFKRILLLRDPRDVVVSFALSPLKRQPWHHHYEYYTKALKSDDERIMATIRGFDRGASTDTPLEPVQEAFGGYLGWLEDPSTLVVRFEDLVGPLGGGDAGKQLSEIERIAKFVERPIGEQQAHRIAEGMYGKKSYTYRKGQTGDWQNRFTESHRDAFKEAAGDILIRLGYEDDKNW